MCVLICLFVCSIYTHMYMHVINYIATLRDQCELHGGIGGIGVRRCEGIMEIYFNLRNNINGLCYDPVGISPGM